MTRDDRVRARDQFPRDVDEQRGEHGLLAGEVPVDGGPADADRGAEVLERDALESAGSEEVRRPRAGGPTAAGPSRAHGKFPACRARRRHFS